jgi:hypothetical protein
MFYATRQIAFVHGSRVSREPQLYTRRSLALGGRYLQQMANHVDHRYPLDQRTKLSK